MMPAASGTWLMPKITVIDKGVNGGNVGTIYVGTGTVTTGVPAVIHELIPPGFNKVFRVKSYLAVGCVKVSL